MGRYARHVSLPEITRAHLTEEIVYLENKLRYEEALKKKEEEEYEILLEAALKGGHKGVKSPLNGKKANDSDITQLYWPRFFGEICLLDPDKCINLGTVKADSACEVFAIHKNQLQTFHIGEDLIHKITARQIQYPDDNALMAKIDTDKFWVKYRSEIMKGIPRNRWPTKEEEFEQMVFSNHTIF